MDVILSKILAHLFTFTVGYFFLRGINAKKSLFLLSYLFGFIILGSFSFIYTIQKKIFIQDIFIFTALVLIILFIERKIQISKKFNINFVYVFLITVFITLFGLLIVTPDSAAYIYMAKEFSKTNYFIVENLYFNPMYPLFILLIQNIFNLSYITETNFFIIISTFGFIILNQSTNLKNKKIFFILSGILTMYFFSNYLILINSFYLSPGLIFGSLILLSSYLLIFTDLNIKIYKIIFYVITLSIIFLRIEGFLFSFFFILIYISKYFQKNDNLYKINKYNFLIYFSCINILFFTCKLLVYLKFNEGFLNKEIFFLTIVSSIIILFIPYVFKKLSTEFSLKVNNYTITNLILFSIVILNIIFFILIDKTDNYIIIFQNLFFTSFWGQWWITTFLLIMFSIFYIFKNINFNQNNLEVLKFFLIFINFVFFLGNLKVSNWRLDLTDPNFYIWGDSGNRLMLYISLISFLLFISIIKKIISK